jgi:hypothetical protein
VKNVLLHASHLKGRERTWRQHYIKDQETGKPKSGWDASIYINASIFSYLFNVNVFTKKSMVCINNPIHKDPVHTGSNPKRGDPVEN